MLLKSRMEGPSRGRTARILAPGEWVFKWEQANGGISATSLARMA